MVSWHGVPATLSNWSVCMMQLMLAARKIGVRLVPTAWNCVQA